MAEGIRRVGIWMNPQKARARPLALTLANWLEGRGHEVAVPPWVSDLVGPRVQIATPDVLGERVGLLVVLGGDGTLLGAARQTSAAAPPLLGVNLGHLGFLTEVEEAELFTALPGILDGEYSLDERMMLECEVHGAGRPVERWRALNDVVLTKGPFARLLRLRVGVDDREVVSYPGDGIIISTPTGSTAYSLSAGGPVLHPHVDGILVSPICPHTLYSRPLLLSAGERLVLRTDSDQGPTRVDVALTVDAQEGRALVPGEWVEVAASPQRARLVRRPGWNFYAVLRRKLAEDDRLGLERDSL